jgi:hypothetical protein
MSRTQTATTLAVQADLRGLFAKRRDDIDPGPNLELHAPHIAHMLDGAKWVLGLVVPEPSELTQMGEADDVDVPLPDEVDEEATRAVLQRVCREMDEFPFADDDFTPAVNYVRRVIHRVLAWHVRLSRDDKALGAAVSVIAATGVSAEAASVLARPVRAAAAVLARSSEGPRADALRDRIAAAFALVVRIADDDTRLHVAVDWARHVGPWHLATIIRAVGGVRDGGGAVQLALEVISFVVGDRAGRYALFKGDGGVKILHAFVEVAGRRDADEGMRAAALDGISSCVYTLMRIDDDGADGAGIAPCTVNDKVFDVVVEALRDTSAAVRGAALRALTSQVYSARLPTISCEIARKIAASCSAACHDAVAVGDSRVISRVSKLVVEIFKLHADSVVSPALLAAIKDDRDLRPRLEAAGRLHSTMINKAAVNLLNDIEPWFPEPSKRARAVPRRLRTSTKNPASHTQAAAEEAAEAWRDALIFLNPSIRALGVAPPRNTAEDERWSVTYDVDVSRATALAPGDVIALPDRVVVMGDPFQLESNIADIRARVAAFAERVLVEPCDASAVLPAFSLDRGSWCALVLTTFDPRRMDACAIPGEIPEIGGGSSPAIPVEQRSADRVLRGSSAAHRDSRVVFEAATLKLVTGPKGARPVAGVDEARAVLMDNRAALARRFPVSLAALEVDEWRYVGDNMRTQETVVVARVVAKGFNLCGEAGELEDREMPGTLATTLQCGDRVWCGVDVREGAVVPTSSSYFGLPLQRACAPGIKGRGGPLMLGRALSLDINHDNPSEVSVGPRVNDDPTNPGPRFISVAHGLPFYERPMDWAQYATHVDPGTIVNVLADRDPTYELVRMSSTRTERRRAEELPDQLPAAAGDAMPAVMTVERTAFACESGVDAALFRAPSGTVYAPCVFDNLSVADVDGLLDMGLVAGAHENIRSWSLVIVATATAGEYAADLESKKKLYKIGFRTGLTCGRLDGASYVHRTAPATVHQRAYKYFPREGDDVASEGCRVWNRMLRIDGGGIHGLEVVSDGGDSGALVWAPIDATAIISPDGLHASTRAVAVGIQCAAANGYALATHIDDVCTALNVSLHCDVI